MTLTPTSWTEPSVPPAFEDQNGFMLPAGTVTLLLADMEGSVRAWERDRDAMTEAVGRLDRLVDDTVGRYGGVRPEQQGEGDSFVAAFARASDAVAAALELQLALAGGEWVALPLRLRMGLHTGEVQLRDEANYVGSAVNRCGRLRSMASGGQTLQPRRRAAESAGPVERCWVAASSSGCPTPLSVGAARASVRAYRV